MTPTPGLTPGSRVSTLELFFDLVFVFTVTQVTQVVAYAHGPAGYAQAALILGMLWWMYGGHAWLTNNVGTDSLLHRLLLLCGMVSFLVAALAIPSAFGAGGVVFGLAYLLVALMHAVLFTHAQNSSALAILRIAPFNLGGALLVILAGVLGSNLRFPLWLLAFLLPVASTLFRRYGAFNLSPQHFVERHGLVLPASNAKNAMGRRTRPGTSPGSMFLPIWSSSTTASGATPTRGTSARPNLKPNTPQT